MGQPAWPVTGQQVRTPVQAVSEAAGAAIMVTLGHHSRAAVSEELSLLPRRWSRNGGAICCVAQSLLPTLNRFLGAHR